MAGRFVTTLRGPAVAVLRGAMNYAQRTLVRRLGFSLLLAVLLAENGRCNCRFKVPLCDDSLVSTVNDDPKAEYGELLKYNASPITRLRTSLVR